MAQKNLVTKVEEFDKASTINEEGDKTELSGYAPALGVAEDYYGPSKFDVEEAWEDLVNLPSSGLIYLDKKTQKEVGLEIGTNVSQEFPWKQVKYKDLLDHIYDTAEGWSEFRQNIQGIELDDRILIGLANHLADNEDEDDVVGKGDLFLCFGTHYAAEEAGRIIKNIEAHDRGVLQKQLVKYSSGQWVSQGSEQEVDITIPKKRGPTVDVEVQSVYPIRPYSTKLREKRSSDDVRDGYIELIPTEKKFDNVFRRRVTIGVQSAPETITLEQQTDPTFPMNAWSQYLYEVSKEDEGLDESDEEEIKPTSKAVTPAQTPVQQTPKPPPEVSSQVNQLLGILEFNQIDMYRNDYPLISEKDVHKYVAPHMEEFVSFANIKMSFLRYVSGVDWYPTMSGLVAVSYTFTTLNSTISAEARQIDSISRVILEPNPVLLWSFDDSLYFKLQFIAPREITCLSFCPYDENILVGGGINGQIVLWDLQGRVSRFGHEEILTSAQIKYRAIMEDFLSWTKPINEEITVQPDAISLIEASQTGPIIQITWLSRKNYVSKTGKIYETKNNINTFFATTSFDGSIAFWDLDPAHAPGKSALARSKLPALLTTNISPLKKLDRIFKPEFMIELPEPITGCLLYDAIFTYKPMVPKDTKPMQVRMLVKGGNERALQPNFCVSCAMGKIYSIQWEGFDIDTGDTVNTEMISFTHPFPKVHDGFVLGIERNPHNKDIFLTYGRFVFAIWKEGINDMPMFWRKTNWVITSVKWSIDRPAVFFLARSDGFVEAWDFIVQTDQPCLVEPLGGGAISSLSEHRPPIPKKVLGIGDYNSSFRMIELPPSYYQKLPNESQNFNEVIEREIRRKQRIRKWQEEWFEKNVEIIEIKKQAEEQILLDFDRIRKEGIEAAEKRAKAEAEQQKKLELKAKKLAGNDITERLEQKWDEIILQRYMEVLMERKKVDREKLEKLTVLEKERLSYEKAKKVAIKRSLQKVDEEMSAARALLLPVERLSIRRSIAVSDHTRNIMAQTDVYDHVKKKCDKAIENFPEFEDLKYDECLNRGRLRQELINASLGANTGRRNFYANLKNREKAQFEHIGLRQFLGSLFDIHSSDFSSEDLDEVPVKEERASKVDSESKESAEDS